MVNCQREPTENEEGITNRWIPTVSIHKWNLSFDGTGCVTEFIEEVERLAKCRKTSLDQVFDSIYELLRKERCLSGLGGLQDRTKGSLLTG